MQDYWQQHWVDPRRRQKLIEQGQAGNLGEYESLIVKYVPKDLPILEAGCGLGQMVLALQRNGYNAIGIDYEPQVVQFVKQENPGLDLRVGNIRKLDFPDGSIGCCLSLGVLEHLEDGPVEALAEVRRVLHPRGVALISVPYLNPARRATLESMGSAFRQAESRTDLSFYQYYYGKAEFTSLIENAGLKVVDRQALFVDHMLVREHPLFGWYWNSPLCRFRMKQPIRRALQKAPAWLRQRYAHMLMYVCRRADHMEGGFANQPTRRESKLPLVRSCTQPSQGMRTSTR